MLIFRGSRLGIGDKPAKLKQCILENLFWHQLNPYRIKALVKIRSQRDYYFCVGSLERNEDML